MKARTLIIDDEELARERLRRLLSTHPEIELIGECADGAEAVAAIRKETPDLVFLDVQMPELDGFAVLEGIEAEAMPVIVFVTAHDKFALRAFEVHAVDYLLKPFDRQRFALERLNHRDKVSDAQTAVLTEVTNQLPAPGPKAETSKPIERLAVKSEGRIKILKTSEIWSVEAAHNYVEIHQDKQSHLLRENIGAIEKRLPSDKFVRISRSVIVNVDRVKELEPMFHGEYSVTMLNGKKLTLSRRYRSKLPLLGVT